MYYCVYRVSLGWASSGYPCYVTKMYMTPSIHAFIYSIIVQHVVMQLLVTLFKLTTGTVENIPITTVGIFSLTSSDILFFEKGITISLTIKTEAVFIIESALDITIVTRPVTAILFNPTGK